MNYPQPGFESTVQTGPSDRSAFLNKTYNHLLGAILGFIAVEMVLFKTGIAEKVAMFALQGGSGSRWLLILGAFMVVSWLFSNLADRVDSRGAAYAGLAGYVVAEALLFAIPIYYAWVVMSPEIVKNAALFTLVGFGALSAIVYFTGKDFSFLRTGLMWGGFAALGLIVMGALTGFHLGTYFTVGMIAFAGAAILYSTSNVLHHYPDDRYVAAALSLFASVMLMFWYVLQLFMSRD